MAYAGPATRTCSASWQYQVIDNEGLNNHQGAGPVYEDYNGTSSAASATFTETSAATAGYTVTGNGGVSINVIFGSVNTSVGGGLSESTTTSVGNSITISIPAHQYGNGQDGAWRETTEGESYYLTGSCTEEDTSTTWSYFPSNHQGWYAWDSTSS